MSVNLKQNLDLIDYFAPLAVAALFAIIVSFIFLTILNYCCVAPQDDLTVVEEWGYRHHMHVKLGPHRPSVIARAYKANHPSFTDKTNGR